MVSVNWETVKANVQSLSVWTYWIVGLIIVSTISYVLFARLDKQIAALLVFITSTMALYYYYVKWFVIPPESVFTPPICPDFLTNVGFASGSTTQFRCIDKVGVSSSFTKAASDTIGNAITNYTPNGTINANDGYVITPTPTATSLDTYCAALRTAGLTWVGMCP